MAARPTIAVFGASRTQPDDDYYEEARLCGRLLAESGYRVATGGYAGTMEAVSMGAREADGDVLGITAPQVFRDRTEANAFVTHERQEPTLTSRIGALVEQTDGAIALWGSLGTAAELVVAWNVAYVSQFSSITRKPLIAVGEPWASLIPHLEETLVTLSGLVTIADDVREAVRMLDVAGRSGN
jgi:uncharacterized protein (TIGR00725 family)